ncbi:MAG: hypothetical protein V3S98_05280 [Dehalococcoidia bacterium]
MKYLSTDIQSADAVESVEDTASRLPDQSVRAYSPLQMHFLARLQRLDGVRVQMASMPGQDPFMAKLVGRGLFATYRECVDEGIGAEARHILKI